MPDASQLGIARAHATNRVPTASPDQSVGEVRAALLGARFDCADDVAVLDGRSLSGVLPIERLLAADEHVRVGDVMDADPPIVALGADQETVAWEMVRRGESSVAVVDAAGHFAGLVPPHRMIGILLAEHDEDVARLGGYLASTRRARQAAEEPVARRLWHRLPWLLVGLAGAIASAGLVGEFEEELQENVLLAFFIPGVIYMAAAIGTQTQAVLIRGLSVGVSVGQVLRREVVSGLVISLVLAVVLFPIVLAGWSDVEVAFAVAVALLASSVAATLVAIALPWAFQRLGSDPAFGSGPLATIVQDVLTILIYLGTAVLVVA
jgi:magnesium transporter